MITPNPDLNSRYPTMYCKTCGNGWPGYVKCDRKSWNTFATITCPCCLGRCNAPDGSGYCDTCEGKGTIESKTVCDFTGDVRDDILQQGNVIVATAQPIAAPSVGTDWSKLKAPTT